MRRYDPARWTDNVFAQSARWDDRPAVDPVMGHKLESRPRHCSRKELDGQIERKRLQLA